MSKFASLTSGLLARKGEAEPASTPFADQLLTRIGAHGPELREHVAEMEPPPPAPVLTKPRPAFALQSSAFGRRPVSPQTLMLEHYPTAEHGGDEDAESVCQPCIAPAGDDPGKTFHVNLRLKRQRFVKLKLSAALLRRPAQDIVSEALDQWFDKLPPDVLGDCACMRSSHD